MFNLLGNAQEKLMELVNQPAEESKSDDGEKKPETETDETSGSEPEKRLAEEAGVNAALLASTSLRTRFPLTATLLADKIFSYAKAATSVAQEKATQLTSIVATKVGLDYCAYTLPNTM